MVQPIVAADSGIAPGCFSCAVSSERLHSALDHMSTTKMPIQIAPNELVGHWRAAQRSVTIDWVFHGDGTFTGKMTQGSRIISDFTGTWSLDGTSLVSVYTSDSCGMIDVGYKDRDTFLEFASDQFVIRTTGTGNRRYKRVT